MVLVICDPLVIGIVDAERAQVSRHHCSGYLEVDVAISLTAGVRKARYAVLLEERKKDSESRQRYRRDLPRPPVKAQRRFEGAVVGRKQRSTYANDPIVHYTTTTPLDSAQRHSANNCDLLIPIKSSPVPSSIMME